MVLRGFLEDLEHAGVLGVVGVGEGVVEEDGLGFVLGQFGAVGEADEEAELLALAVGGGLVDVQARTFGDGEAGDGEVGAEVEAGRGSGVELVEPADDAVGDGADGASDGFVAGLREEGEEEGVRLDLQVRACEFTLPRVQSLLGRAA